MGSQNEYCSDTHTYGCVVYRSLCVLYINKNDTKRNKTAQYFPTNLKYCTAGHSYTYVYCIKCCDKVPKMAITGVDC